MKYKSPYQLVTPYGEPTLYARYVQGAPMQTYWPYLHDLLFVKRIPFYTLEVNNRIIFPDRVWKLWTNRPSSYRSTRQWCADLCDAPESGGVG